MDTFLNKLCTKCNNAHGYARVKRNFIERHVTHRDSFKFRCKHCDTTHFHNPIGGLSASFITKNKNQINKPK